MDQDGKLITYFPEVPQVLEYLKSEGYPIGNWLSDDKIEQCDPGYF